MINFLFINKTKYCKWDKLCIKRENEISHGILEARWFLKGIESSLKRISRHENMNFKRLLDHGMSFFAHKYANDFNRKYSSMFYKVMELLF